MGESFHRDEIDGTLPARFAAQVKRHGTRIALSDGRSTVTYDGLSASARRIATAIAQAAGPGEEPVALLLETGNSAMVGIFATLLAGRAYVPVDPSYPRPTIEHMIADSGARLILGHAPTAALGSELARGGMKWLDIDRAGDVAGAPPSPSLTPDSSACIIYTSGSTGKPKGILHTHRTLLHHIWSHTHACAVTCEDRQALLVSYSFAASFSEIFGALLNGARLCQHQVKRAGIADLAAWLRREQITIFKLPVSLFRIFLAALPADETFPSVRRVVLGGDALFAKDVLGARRHFPATCSLMNRLTSSEALSQTRFVIDSTTTLPDVVVPVGYPEDDKDVLILGEDLRELAPGEVGEIAIRSAYLTPGYWQREDLNRATFLPGPPGDPRRIYRTGDLGRLRPDGCLEHLGRSDRQVKIRGYRVELGAIEATLTALDAVKEAAVVVRGRGDDAESSQIVAYVVPAAEPAPSIDSLRTALAASLPDYMIPASFLLISALPMTATGKVDRAALPAPAATRPNLLIPFLSPRTEVEQAVAKIWAATLGLDRVGAHDNFFDLGGDSLLLLSVHARLRDRFAIDLPVIDMFRSPTVAALGAALAQRLATGRAEPTVRSVAVRSPQSPAIAIIGMAGVFPGAADIAAFWANLRQGVESIAILDDETLRRSGVDEELLANPRYVKRVPLLPEWKAFDAAFFDLPALDAALLDPQHRMLLQVAWHALEHAGTAANTDGERIGIFAGCCQSAYFLQHLWPRRSQLRGVSDLQLRMANDPEFLATRIAYKLDLRGPAVNVQTACSTSLVAVHLACQSLARGECAIALAGGSSVETPEPAGYLHEEGWICSPDGHCRPFDARAQGTVIGSGAGMVVLKPLERAVADRDTVHAVIRGSAINNDGALKVGFAAPSVEGQTQVIAAALATAGATADDIDYVETHGTGTALGDPIEIAALTSAFRATSARTGDCPIGAVKSNVGHLSRAAGIAGLIKTVLCLEHGEIPPVLHFEKPNPHIDFSQTPFVVSSTLQSWPARASRTGRPRMAAVSSFGVGGTNAHAILEQAPPHSSHPSRFWQLLVLSARTETALETTARNLARVLGEQPGAELADVAFTLQAGRRAFEHRHFVVCRDRQDAVARLSAGVRPVPVARSQPPNVVFLFPGQGAQYANMGRGLYDEEPVFRAQVDRCAQALREPLGVDLREVLFSPPAEAADAGARLRETWLTQPALFVIQYALAKLWMHWGVRPSAMLGHSIGEHTAACLAGVMSLEDTLAIIARWGKLLHALPRGCMLAVHLDEQQARGYLSNDISLAAVNAPSLCVMAGAEAAIRALMATLADQGIDHHLLHTSHAFHSAMMDPVLDDFTREVAALRLRQPSIPYVSGVTGDWITQQDAGAPDYWSRLLRGTVRFSEGLRRLSVDPTAVFLEVGPGRSLITLAGQHEGLRDHVLLPSLRSQGESRPDREVLLTALGELWRQGVRIDWRAHHGDPRRKIPLPQYPFEPREYWIGRAKLAPTASGGASDAALSWDDGGEREDPQRPKSPKKTPAIEAILRAPAGDRNSLVLAWLRQTLAALKGTEDSPEIPDQTSLEEAGIDSLASIRLCAWIETELKIRVAVNAILSAGSVTGLAALLSDTIAASEAVKQQEDHHG